jgi:hypothetical protein
MPDEMPDILKEGRHEDQLDPVAVPYHNLVMKGPPGTGVGDLSTWVGADDDGYASTVSTWAPDERLRKLIAAGANIRLTVAQHPTPPVAVEVEPPFCELHREIKLYDQERASFVCYACGDPADPPKTKGVPDELRRDFRPGEGEPDEADG